MKKLLLFFAALILFVGCSRGSGSEETVQSGTKKGYFVRYNQNGVKKEDVEEKNPFDQTKWIIVSRFEEDLSAAYGNSYDLNFNLDIMLNLAKHPLTTGTYVWSSTATKNTLNLTYAKFYDDQTKDSYQYYGLSNRQSNIILKITEVTPTYAKGTFEGVFFCHLLNGTEKAFTISGGEFYLPIEKE